MNRILTCFPVTALMFLGACGSDSEPETAAATSSAPVAKEEAPPDRTSKMARAVGNGKPGAAVDIRYEFLAKPAVGAPTDLEVAFIPNAGVDALQVVISGIEGVTLSGSLTPSFADVEAGNAYTHTFTLLPDRAGVFYITVAVNTEIGGSTLGRTFSIPFVVGDLPVQKKAEPARDSSGEAIESMKAVEEKG